jgi:hypothetical protein
MLYARLKDTKSSRIYEHFIEPKGLLPCSQEPDTVLTLSLINPIYTGPLHLSNIHFNFIFVGCILLRYVYVYLSTTPAITTENLLVLLIILSVHNMFRPLRAIFR